MPLTFSHQTNCPRCGTSQEITLCEGVNVTVEPAFKEKVLQRAINRAECLHCGQEFRPVADFLYHDRNQNFMVWLRQEGAIAGEDMNRRLVQLKMHDKVLRIVHDECSLVEKIRIFDNQLDDSIIEFLKLILWPEVSGRRSEPHSGSEIRFVGFHWPLLTFEFNDDGKRRRFTYPYQEYVARAPLVAPARARITRGSWCLVDREFITASGVPALKPKAAKKESRFAIWTK